MKHAYLIIAHNEFEVLQTLIDLLDDERNSMYVHIDKKVKQIPSLVVKRAKLIILQNRIDVRWGHLSQVEVELLLMQTALHSGADYYHIISGVTLPLKSMDGIDDFFATKADAYFCPMPTSRNEIDLKLRRLNFNTKYFICPNKHLQAFNQFVWHILIAVQQMLCIRRNKRYDFEKASQWCSLSGKAVSILLQKRDGILMKYRYTLCPDEFFCISELKGAVDIVLSPSYLHVEFVGTSPITYKVEERGALASTGCLWARKFVQ